VRELKFIDKTNWPRGPWDAEPDKVQWTDPATGMTCLAVRHDSSGHWCGYVGVTEGHPCFGLDYDAAYDRADVEVHGGLTYASFCVEDDKEHGVCHIPEPGQPDRVWWLGFDCAHSGDKSPRWDKSGGGKYRTLDYVKQQCAELAEQLAGALA